jgi:hypothetical protein
LRLEVFTSATAAMKYHQTYHLIFCTHVSVKSLAFLLPTRYALFVWRKPSGALRVLRRRETPASCNAQHNQSD